MGILYKHYSDFTLPWVYPNFSVKEMSCKHCGEFYYHQKSLQTLQALRTAWALPMVINSAHRCFFHNVQVGGAKESMHLKLAFDCACAKNLQSDFVKLAEEIGFTGIGSYVQKNFVHLDLAKKRKWVA